MVHDWFVHKRSETEFVEIPLAPGDDWSDTHDEDSAIDAGAGARRIDAAAGLRQPEQPLVGRLADLRLRSGRRREAAHRRGRQAEGRSDEAAAGRSGDRRAPERLHRQLVDRARDAPHAVHARAQLHLRSAAPRASGLDRRAAVRQGQAHQLRADGEDPHRGVDAGDPSAPDHPARDAHELVRPRRRGTAGGVHVPERQRDSRRHRRLQARSSHRPVLAHRGVRLGLPDASAHPRRGAHPLARRPTPCSKRSSCPTCPAARRPAS